MSQQSETSRDLGADVGPATLWSSSSWLSSPLDGKHLQKCCGEESDKGHPTVADALNCSARLVEGAEQQLSVMWMRSQGDDWHLTELGACQSHSGGPWNSLRDSCSCFPPPAQQTNRLKKEHPHRLLFSCRQQLTQLQLQQQILVFMY